MLVRHPAEEHPQVARRLPLVVVEELVAVRLRVRHARGTRFPNRKLCNEPASEALPDQPRSVWRTGNTRELTPPGHRLYIPAAKDCQARREQEIVPACIQRGPLLGRSRPPVQPARSWMQSKSISAWPREDAARLLPLMPLLLRLPTRKP